MQLGFRELAHRATQEALGIRWVAMLPIIPYLINHLSFARRHGLAPSLIFNVVVITYAMMQPEKAGLMEHVSQRMRKHS